MEWAEATAAESGPRWAAASGVARVEVWGEATAPCTSLPWRPMHAIVLGCGGGGGLWFVQCMLWLLVSMLLLLILFLLLLLGVLLLPMLLLL